MEYEYRYLSEERAAEIDSKGFTDNLGRKIHINSGESVTNKDETVVFQQTWFSHENEEPDEYFLEYKSCYYFIDMYIKSITGENVGENKYWYYVYDIKKIYNTNYKNEETPDREFIETIRNVVFIKKQYGKKNRKQGDKVFITVMYKGEEV